MGEINPHKEYKVRIIIELFSPMEVLCYFCKKTGALKNRTDEKKAAWKKVQHPERRVWKGASVREKRRSCGSYLNLVADRKIRQKAEKKECNVKFKLSPRSWSKCKKEK